MLRAKTILPFVTAALTFAAITATRDAHAQVRTEMGNRGVLVIDQLSGFRVSTVGGVSYEGPIGFSFQSYGQSNGAGKTTTHFTNFWLAPSADIFVIDHLSIGGLIEFVSTSATQDAQANGTGTTITTTLPTKTSFTFLPRVGWLFAVSDRFGIWPRGGLGYASQSLSNVNGNGKDSTGGFLLDIDVGFIFRVNDTFFFKAAPEMTVGLGPSRTITLGNGTSLSYDASLFQFAGLAGIGVMWDL